MSNEEIITFIQQIKSDYKDFQLTNDEYELWHDALSKLGQAVAQARYDEHKNNSKFGKKAPNIKIFMYGENEKKNNNTKYLRECEHCKKLLYNDAMNKHIARHNSVRYIKKTKLKYWHKETTKEEENEFMNLTEVEFDKRYDEFLKKVYEVSNNSLEKTCIEHALNLELKTQANKFELKKI